MGSAEGGEVTDDLSKVSDVAGVTDVVIWEVLGFTLVNMGPAAWGPHTFST